MGLQPDTCTDRRRDTVQTHLESHVHVIPRGGPGRLQHPVARFPSFLPSHPTPSKVLFIDIHHTRVMSDRATDVREKFQRFRILVIGRANAGKTTLLQRVCKTTEFPIVRDRRGKKVIRRLLCRQRTVSY